MIGILLPAEVRAAVGIPLGAALAVYSVVKREPDGDLDLLIVELGQPDGRRWTLHTVAVDQLQGWLRDATC